MYNCYMFYILIYTCLMFFKIIILQCFFLGKFPGFGNPVRNPNSEVYSQRAKCIKHCCKWQISILYRL